jgi:hypothetical protein
MRLLGKAEKQRVQGDDSRVFFVHFACWPVPPPQRLWIKKNDRKNKKGE